ncbi:very low-density lipoprotein receptor-like isoform X1 [Oppia nitens]|uniref:very low-density lipoprotein receptor-like isoform X1 n=1 Tax=Oppia nitens TaxID=1686743 RepID=UPI0023DCC681|nr:very low-density lipoprotein receptor-like isoform X1 [Oppia nitens]
MLNIKLFVFALIVGCSLVYSKCPSNFFDCGNDRCIGHFWRCDGEDDCGNWADEQSCGSPTAKTRHEIIEKHCAVNHTHCNDTYGTCIPNKWLCDGMEDCSNGNDEKNCTKDRAQCSGFLCNTFECIPSRWRCDGIPDCEDASDETNCPSKPKHDICDKEHGFYKCLTGECIPIYKLCDKRKDCPQGDDEGTECRSSGCHTKNCSQLCFVESDGPQCYCREGFSLGSDNTTCFDIDECDDGLKGLCSQKCVNIYGGYKCKCSEGYKLINNRSCIAAEEEPLLLFSNSEGIRGFWLRSKQFFPVFHSSKQTIGIDYLAKKDRVYWVELDETPGIYSSTLMGDYFKPIVTKNFKAPEDLAIDWVGENIYITDGDLHEIIVCNIDGDMCASGLFGVLDKPRAIVVDPSNGTVYWTEWGEHPGIYMAGMDGSNKHHLINNNLIWPNGIALDSATNRLYWSDAKVGRIEYMDLKTNQRVIVLSDKVFHPFSLDVFEDWVYWSDWMTYSLDKSHKLTGHNQSILIRERDEQIMGVHIYHPLIQKQSYNPCYVHKCSHMCVLAPNRRHTCVCPDNLVLSKDKKTCENIPEEVYEIKEKVLNISHDMLTIKGVVDELPDELDIIKKEHKMLMNRTTDEQSAIVVNQSSDDKKGWLTFGIAVGIVTLIVVLVYIVIKRDDYSFLTPSEIRNVLYSRGDQIRTAISFNNPVFNKAFGRHVDDDEQLIDDDINSQPEDNKY